MAFEAVISEVPITALEQLRGASTLDAVEAVRVEALGRKGRLAEISKEFGKLSPEERARVGKLLNSAKQELEAKIEARKASLEQDALNARLDSEWIDLTAPAPGPRPGGLHPVAQVQRGSNRCSSPWDSPCSTAPKSGPKLQLRRAQHSRRSSRARHAGHLLAQRRPPAAHPHFARAGRADSKRSGLRSR